MILINGLGISYYSSQFPATYKLDCMPDLGFSLWKYPLANGHADLRQFLENGPKLIVIVNKVMMVWIKTTALQK